MLWNGPKTFQVRKYNSNFDFGLKMGKFKIFQIYVNQTKIASRNNYALFLMKLLPTVRKAAGTEVAKGLWRGHVSVF